MNKKRAFLLTILVTLLIANTLYCFSILKGDKREKVIVGRVIDGDTLELQDGRHVRLLNINSPEKGSIGYNLSLFYLSQFEGKGIEMQDMGPDKYQRTLARLFSPSYINLDLVRQGFVSKFLVDKEELKEFSIAEKDAIEKGLGIWKKSDYFGCVRAEINKKEEYVELKNSCASADAKGWYLKDESRKTFTFSITSFTQLTLHSEKGENSEKDLYWREAGNIWNDDRDSLYLFDKNGGLIEYETYGY